MSSETTIHMPYAQFQKMERELESMRRQLADAQQAALPAQVGNAGMAWRDAFLLHAMPIVQYAIATFEPMAHRGFPHEALSHLAVDLSSLPGVPSELSEISTDLRMVARDAKKWEDARAEGREQELLREMNARHMGVHDVE